MYGYLRMDEFAAFFIIVRCRQACVVEQTWGTVQRCENEEKNAGRFVF